MGLSEYANRPFFSSLQAVYALVANHSEQEVSNSHLIFMIERSNHCSSSNSGLNY